VEVFEEERLTMMHWGSYLPIIRFCMNFATTGRLQKKSPSSWQQRDGNVYCLRMTSSKKDPSAGDVSLELQVFQKQIEDLQAQVTSLITDLDAAKTEGAKMKDLAARSQADLQNAKARVERERMELSAFALESMMKRLLPTIDSFQRAFQHLPEDLQAHEWVKGVMAIEGQLMRELEGAGLKRMSSMGTAVDSDRHEVLQQGAGKKDAVMEVFEEGYELHGKVLRPAKVKIGDGTEL
jgi:molecular chaperone GrpE